MRSPDPRPPAERFWPRVNKNGPIWNGTPCWEWIGGRNRLGYGVFNIRHGKQTLAYVFAYEQLVGPVPEGKELDHLCRNHPCVNPDHLEPVTHQVNIQRGLAGKIKNPQTSKTHCPKGHPYNKENTLFSGGRRSCRICCREKMRLRRGSIKRRRSPYYDGGG
jgi:hypothetical protein